MDVRRADVDLLHRVASRLIIGYDEQDLGAEVDQLADRMSAEVGVCVRCKGTGLAAEGSSGLTQCTACDGSGEVMRSETP